MVFYDIVIVVGCPSVLAAADSANNYKIDIKHSSMCVILHRLNLSYTRPTYVLKKADKKKQEEFKNFVRIRAELIKYV